MIAAHDKYSEFRHLSLGVRYYLRRWPFRDAKIAERFGSGLVVAGMCCRENVDEFIARMREAGKVE